ncbi:MAG: efflux RND transporter periplasmic adaptor subunit [candidate division Zixibacteria bacterium]|nr:efflux RND transporter periplasmic adaptor subunit [candidate division Zixibacteria bacterium]
MGPDTTKPDLSSLRIHRDAPSPAAMGAASKRRGPWIWLGPLVVVALVAIFLAMRGRARTIEVETTTVQRLSPASAQSLLTATGYVVAQRQASVASKGAGRLEQLNVEEGDRVKSGDVIARLEARDVDASLNAARARVAQAQAQAQSARATAHQAKVNFDRVRRLLDAKLVSQSDFDNAQAGDNSAAAAVNSADAAVRSAEADVKWAEVQVENTYIRAPFDGTVLTKDADVGEVVAPFASSASSKGSVVTLADMTSLEVEADVSESNIQRVQPGQPCLIVLDAFPADPYKGRVKKVVPTADRSKATVKTKVSFDTLDARVLPEMSAKVSFLPADMSAAAVTTKTVMSIPKAAITERAGKSVVYVVRQGSAYETLVTTGETYGGAIEITNGLEIDEVVVLYPPPQMQDRDRIKLKQ